MRKYEVKDGYKLAKAIIILACITLLLVLWCDRNKGIEKVAEKYNVSIKEATNIYDKAVLK